MKRRVLVPYFSILMVLLLAFGSATHALAQAAKGSVRGQVTDPSGAVIPNANVSLTTPDGHTVATVTSNAGGSYQVHNLTPGTYIVIANAQGFASSNSKAISVGAGQTKQFDVSLAIQVEQQQVQVNAEGTTVDTSPDSNANAVVLKGKDLDALSDDPDELQNELQALAGPSAGPNGGQIYIDGFTGGQLPPKSSIREIRVNQNPFSAQYDRLGYGRIEILTKPGTDKMHGSINARGTDSSFNAANPILNSNLQPGQPTIPFPDYYTYFLNGNIGGSLTKKTSFFLNAFGRNIQNVSVVDAINPAETTDPNNPVYLNTTVGTPSTRIDISPRFDIQLGEPDTLTARYSFTRNTQSNAGIGTTSLPSVGYNTHSIENEIQLSNSWVMSPRVVNDMRFEYTRTRAQQTPLSTDPTISVQGAFTSGGSNSGTLRDNQDYFELQDYFTAAEGAHSLNFGARLRATRDANYTDAGTNGLYTYQSLTAYLANQPQKFQYTQVNNNAYTARATLFDSGLFYQDDWKVNQRFTFSYGLRWEAQNYIHNINSWAPRLSFAYALDGGGKKPAKTVLRAGYGWFYNRFGVANSFGGGGSTPFVIYTIHHNVPPPGGESNQQIVIQSFDPSDATSNPAPIYYQIDSHFRAALDMQGAIGVDRQITKNATANVTYLYSQGIHQYLTNNISALPFDASSGTYIDLPTTGLTAPNENLYTYQSIGFYRQSQVIASGRARFRRVSLFGFYVYNNARSNTGGVNSFLSNAHDPKLDYGRSSFDVHNRFIILGNIQAPWALSFSPFLGYNSGTPYNLTIGNDLTANNQFNARPTFAASCSEAGVVETRFGCLNTNPAGTNERIVPYGYGTGPSNINLNMRVAKVIGLGPKVEGRGPGGGGPGGGRGGRGFTGLSGNQGGPGRLDASVPRKYNLTLTVFAANVLNHQNLGTPNGTLLSPFFDKSQSLAGGFFGPPTAGNRSIFLEAAFNF